MFDHTAFWIGYLGTPLSSVPIIARSVIEILSKSTRSSVGIYPLTMMRYSLFW